MAFDKLKEIESTMEQLTCILNIMIMSEELDEAWAGKELAA